MKKFLPEKFYAILDYNYIEKEKFDQVANNYLLAGIKLIEIKILNKNKRLMKEMILKIKKLKETFDFSLILYDNLELVKDLDLDGIHLDKENTTIKDAQKILKDKIIGKACYNYDQALKAYKCGADFIIMGPLFYSKSEKYMGHYNYISLKELKNAVNSLNIPVVAFGGINLSNIISVINTGVDAVTVVSNIFQDASPMEKIKSVIALFDNEYQKKDILIINSSDKITNKLVKHLEKNFEGFFNYETVKENYPKKHNKKYNLIFYCIGKENFGQNISFDNICKTFNAKRNELVVLTDMDSHVFRSRIKDYKALALLYIEDKTQFMILNLIIESLIKK